MVIDEQAVLAVAELKNFNMELFNKYLIYQKENRCYHPGKWSVEEYAAVMMTRDSNIDFFTHEQLEWFGNWQGFGGEYFIPECLSFLRFCAVRDVYPFNETIDDLLVLTLEKEEN